MSALGLSTVQSSMSQRGNDFGETVIQPASDFATSAFQRIYQGTGVPKDVSDEAIEDSLLAYAKVCEDEAFHTHRHYTKDPEGQVVQVPLSEEDRIRFNQSAAREAMQVGQATIAEFNLAAPEGAAKLYTSESQVVCLEPMSEAQQRKLERIERNVQKWGGQHSSSSTSLSRRSVYKALNKPIGEDDAAQISALLPYIKRFNFYLNQTRHDGGRLFSGVSLSKISRDILVQCSRVRILRFLSTSADEKVCTSHIKDLPGDVRGALLVIDVPAGFWGARAIAEISVYPWEAETIFPPWSQFEVTSICWEGIPRIHMRAMDKYA